MSDVFHKLLTGDEDYQHWRAREEEPMPERNFVDELAEANDEQSRWLFWNCIDQLEDYFGAGRKVPMKTGEAFPSEFLSGDELKGRAPIKVVVSHIEIRKVGDDEKPVMFFKGKKKGMVLNKTNADCIAESYGDEMDDWSGKEIDVYHDPNVSFGGKRTGGIRVRIPLPPEAETGGTEDF